MKRTDKALIIIYTWALIVMLFNLASCRSAQQLIDKAIKKDSTIVKGYSDTITLEVYKLDSIPYYVNDTLYYRDTIIKSYRDTVINQYSIEVERKKTRLEIRKNAQLERIKLRLQAKLADDSLKYNHRINKLEARLAARSDRQINKLEAKPNRWYMWLILGLLTGFILGLRLIANGQR